MTEGLASALRRKGHEVEIVTMPFKFFPESYVSQMMEAWSQQDFRNFNGYKIDKVVVLQFPAYYVRHKNKALWLMHQHRPVYDAYDQSRSSKELNSLREKITARDNEEIAAFPRIYTMSQNVSNRLKRYNGLDSTPVYHPPFGEERFYCGDPYDYIFYPSRFEPHKRQELLIRAMKFVKSPVKAILAGIGGQWEVCRGLVEKLRLQEKVKLLGAVSEEEKVALYARSLAVFFGPYDEDYGYVTLEAMLSCKPVITCTDSGGPLEFVVDGSNGFILEPDAESLAERIDWVYYNQKKAKEMGVLGLEIYRTLQIKWSSVIDAIFGDLKEKYRYLFSNEKISFEMALQILERKNDNKLFRGGIPLTDPHAITSCKKQLKEMGIDLEDLNVTKEEYENFIKRAEYRDKYPDYYKDVFFEKTFEHFVCYKMLKLNDGEIFVDIGSENSPVCEIFQEMINCQGYAQDIMYEKGIHKNYIGSDAGNMPVPDDFFHAAMATCTIEHFEEDADIRFVREMQRTLKPGGKLVIAPLYLNPVPACQTDPACAILGNVRFDEGASIYCVENWGIRFARVYSPETLWKRIIQPNEGMSFKIYLINNAADIQPSIYCRYILVATRK